MCQIHVFDISCKKLKNLIAMESNFFGSHIYQFLLGDLTVERAKSLKCFINSQAETICSIGQANIVLTALFKLIGEIDVR